MKKENDYQAGLIKRIKDRFPGSMVLKNDAGYIQGIPDLTVLYGKRWAALETKRSKDASRRPNQSFYISKMNRMSYASFINPENEQEVLDEMEQAFGLSRKAFFSESKQA